VAILSFGSVLGVSGPAAEQLNATLANMRFVKPLDAELIVELADTHEVLVIVEENAVLGGAGAAVAEVLAVEGRSARIVMVGLPDCFVDHGTQSEQRLSVGLDAAALVERARAALAHARGRAVGAS
jgi:1-deoxy-D-xylulose-5-phosphate synthase